MKILKLTAQNILRLKAVEIAPDGNLVVIGGDNAMGKCVPEGEPVCLWDGTTKPIEAIRETDLLVGLDPQTWRFIPEHPVVLMTSGMQSVYEVSTRRGYHVRLTTQHRLLTPTGWTTLSELSPGCHVAVPLRLPCAEDVAASEADIAGAMLLGLLIGDGCLKENVHFTNTDSKVVEVFERCSRLLFPGVMIRSWNATGSRARSYQLSYGRNGKTSAPHMRWLEATGLRGKCSHDKFVPASVFQGGRQTILACLAGLMSTDGWMTRDGHGEYYTRSRQLARDVRGLLLRLAIPSSLSEQSIAGKPFYRVSIVTNAGRTRFMESVLPQIVRSSITEPRDTVKNSAIFGMPHGVVSLLRNHGVGRIKSWEDGQRVMSRKRFLRVLEEHPDVATIPEIARFTTEDIGWDEIIEVQPLSAMQTFDLQMPSEAFVCSDFIVHNSSVLDSIMLALAGRNAKRHPEPVHQGADSGKIVVELDDLVVTRTFTKAGGGSLKVATREGAMYPSPQAVLDKLTTSLSFDPLEWQRMRAEDQATTLKQLVGLDFTALDARRQELFDERRATNREVAQAGALVQTMPAYPGVQPVSVKDLMGRLRTAQQHNQKLREGAEALKKQREKMETQARRIREKEAEIVDLECRIATLREEIRTAMEQGTAMRRTYEAETAALAQIETADETTLQTQIVQAEMVNAQVRANETRTAAAEALTERQGVSDALTTQIDAIDAEKAKALAQATFPVPGLSFDEDGVTYQGVPFIQASAAEKLRVSVAMGLALHPKLRVLLIRDGSLLDEANLRTVAEMAEAADAQVWLERVGRGKECSVILTDGMVEEHEALAEAAG